MQRLRNVLEQVLEPLQSWLSGPLGAVLLAVTPGERPRMSVLSGTHGPFHHKYSEIEGLFRQQATALRQSRGNMTGREAGLAVTKRTGVALAGSGTEPRSHVGRCVACSRSFQLSSRPVAVDRERSLKVPLLSCFLRMETELCVHLSLSWGNTRVKIL